MQQDERGAWLEEAMVRWEQPLLRMCFAYLNDVALAEDAVQETFLKAWRGYDNFRQASNEKTWLMRIAINTCKDVQRSAWFRRVDRSTSLETLPEQGAWDATWDDTVTKAVMKLRPAIREIVLLHWYQGMTADETAQVLDISRSTVYHRLKRAQAILHRELEAWYHED